MKTTRKVLVCVVTLLAACFVHAEDMKPVNRVISILDIETDDPGNYATLITQYNAAAKSKLGIDNYVRVYETYFDGLKTSRVRAVVTAASVAELMKNTQALENDPGILENLGHLSTLRKFTSRTLYQGLRYDGTDKNASLYTTLAVVTDEAGYLKALDQLRVVFDAIGFKDAKINAYRILAGRTNHTHRITISMPSFVRLGALLDLIGTNQQLAEWLASVAKYRTVVSNSTSREITK